MAKQIGLNGLSKEQETAALKRFAARFGANTYLHTLLSARLISWFSGQIEQDLPPDIIGTLDNYLETTRARFTGEMETLKAQLQNEKEFNADLRQSCRELTAANQDLKLYAEAVDADSESRLAMIDDLRDENAALRLKAEKYDQLVGIMADVKAAQGIADDTVILEPVHKGVTA